jgi:hypothetical protein
MALPFTREQFLAVFTRYNEAVAPAQVVLLAVGIAATALALRPTRWSDRAVGCLLAGLWLWMGIAYHWGFFRTINPAATVFGAAFVASAAMLFWYGVARRRITFRAPQSLHGGLALMLLVYAFVVYPAVGWILGHRYPAMPTFGLPCPTTITTLGLLLWCAERPPVVVMVIPWARALIGAVAALQLGMWEDLGLPVAFAISVWGWLAPQRPRTAASSPASA